MKLAICSPGEIYGGVERQVTDFCVHLQRERGIEPLVVLFHDAEPARRLRAVGIEPAVLAGYGAYDPRLVSALIRLFDTSRIDTVHVHGYKTTVLCALAKTRRPFRLVKTEHGKAEARRARLVRWVKSKSTFWLEQRLTRWAVDAVVYVSEDIATYHAHRHRGLARSIVHNGMEALARSDFDRPADLPPGRCNIGVVGRISPVKGIPLAIAALAEPVMPQDAQLVVVGTGPGMNELEALASRLHVRERVHFLGFRRNIFDYLAHLDVQLIPSYHEGLPYTLLEAMSLERPIAASRVGGLAEVIEDGRTGLLFAAGDIPGLARCVARLLEDADLAAALGAAARAEQMEHYSLARMASDLLAVLAP